MKVNNRIVLLFAAVIIIVGAAGLALKSKTQNPSSQDSNKKRLFHWLRNNNRSTIKLERFAPKNLMPTEKFTLKLAFTREDNGKIKLTGKKVFPYPPLPLDSELTLQEITYGYEFILTSSAGEVFYRITKPVDPGARSFSVLLPYRRGTLIVRGKPETDAFTTKISN